jgi:predicted alpha/beta-fold hydrolase
VPPLPADEGERYELPVSDSSGDRLASRYYPGSSTRDGAPLVALVHGLGGSEDSTYIGVTTAHLVSLGYPVLQLNLRGAGPSRSLCCQQYHAGRSEDFRDALAGLPETLTRNGVAAVGFSLGGNMLLKYAAEHGGLRGVVSVSAPIDLAAASHRFLDARNRGYHLYLLRGMRAEALAASSISDEERVAIPEISTILEFDDRIVAPRNGFVDAADYYARNNARQFLAAVEVPTVLIYARNDPWIPSDAYTSYSWDRNPHLHPLLPTSGGHVGFHASESRIPWHDRCIASFLETIRTSQ